MKGDLRDDKLIAIADAMVECYSYFHIEEDFFARVDELAFKLDETQNFREYVERKVDEKYNPAGGPFYKD